MKKILLLSWLVIGLVVAAPSPAQARHGWEHRHSRVVIHDHYYPVARPYYYYDEGYYDYPRYRYYYDDYPRYYHHRPRFGLSFFFGR